jgi:hypothetical protein
VGDFFPGLHLVGLALRDAKLTVVLVHGVEVDVDGVANLDLDDAFFVGELVQRDDAFGLVADVDHYPVSVDIDDVARNNALFLDGALAEVVFEEGFEVIATDVGDVRIEGESRFGHGV